MTAILWPVSVITDTTLLGVQLFQCAHIQVTFMHLEPSSSSSSSLRPLDVEFMRRLSKVVNIVPVIAKADTLTLEERDFFKQTVRRVFRCIHGCVYALGVLRWDLLSNKMAVLASAGLPGARWKELVLGGHTSSEGP